MEESQVLVFRCGVEKYGIPIENVSGIISNAGTNGLSIFEHVAGVIPLQGETVSISDVNRGCKAEGKKSAIIAQANGVQILIIVDEIIQERIIIDTDSELDATIAPVQIWKFK